MAKTDNLQTNYYATNILLCPRLLVPGECLRISGGKPGRHHVFWGHTARRGRRVGFQAGSFWPHEGVCFFFNQSATPGSNPLGAVPGCLASGECSSTHSCLRPCRCQRWLLQFLLPWLCLCPPELCKCNVCRNTHTIQRRSHYVFARVYKATWDWSMSMK